MKPMLSLLCALVCLGSIFSIAAEADPSWAYLGQTPPGAVAAGLRRRHRQHRHAHP